MSATMTNGKPQRKQLSDQLDRMDGIIDCLADALPEAVRDAVRDGTEAALKQVLVTLLTDPDTLSRIREAAGVPTPSVVPTPSRSATFLARCRAKLSALAGRVLTAVTIATRTVRDVVATTSATLRRKITEATAKVQAVALGFNLIWQLKKAVLISIVIGVAIGSLATVSHSAAAILAGAGAASTAVAVHLGLWARRTMLTWIV